MSPRAILFDLFNTLVPGGSRAERDLVSIRMAHLLDVPPDEFAVLVRRSFEDRVRGRLGDLRETVTWLARQLGAEPEASAVAAAGELRLEMTRSLHERTWAVPVLKDLGRAGVLRGLVTDCSAETPHIWHASPLAPQFEAVSFSCVTGHRKPEPEAYLTAVRALGVEPNDCVFVGDGGSFELTGAQALGMRVVRFRPPAASRGEAIDDDVAWSGDTVTHFADVLPLVTEWDV